VEAGPPEGEPVLLLHGEPSWSFLYRTVMPVLAEAGLRAIAVDLAGFGRSDKPAGIGDHSYARHVEWIRAPMPEVWLRFREVVRTAPELSVSRLVQSGCQTRLSAQVLAVSLAVSDLSYGARRARRGSARPLPTGPLSRAAWPGRHAAAPDRSNRSRPG
jgi:haloalkane dehalogenase